MQRNDFKLRAGAAAPVHGFEVVDEHGRRLGMGRNLAALKAELGTQARSAFKALADLKLAPGPAPASAAASPSAARPAIKGSASAPAAPPPPSRRRRRESLHRVDLRRTARTDGITRGSQQLIGFPALIDCGEGVRIEVFDEPGVAAVKHRAGLRRRLRCRSADCAISKNIPDLQKMAVAYCAAGHGRKLRAQIVGVALDPRLPRRSVAHRCGELRRRVAEGRGRLTLIAGGWRARRSCSPVRRRAAEAQDARPPKEVAEDVKAQLARLCPKDFVAATPMGAVRAPAALTSRPLRCAWTSCAPIRTATPSGSPSCARWNSASCACWPSAGARRTRLDEFRWLLEELRVSLFAQELRTPQPVSVERLEKAWQQLSR